MHARCQLVDQKTFRSDEALHRHHPNVAQLLHNGREHAFGLRLLGRIGLREDHAGAQNAVLMQVVGQGIKDGAAVVGAGTHQRHFTAKVNTLLNDALTIALIRQLVGFTGAQTPLAASVVAANAALDDRQFTQRGKDVRPLAFLRQQLPRSGGEVQIIEQLFLRQTVGNDREDVAVNEGIMARQLPG